MKTKQEILWKINDKMMSDIKMEDSFVREDAAIKAMEEYHQQQLKILNIPVVTNRICPKANQCANTPGGCICPKNVTCPL